MGVSRTHTGCELAARVELKVLPRQSVLSASFAEIGGHLDRSTLAITPGTGAKKGGGGGGSAPSVQRLFSQ